MKLTLTDVVNGSVTPSVTSRLSSGSGAVSHSMMCSWNANVTMKIGMIATSAIDQPRAKLVEVLDERCLLAVVETAREPPTEHEVELLADGFPLGPGFRLVRTACRGSDVADGSSTRVGVGVVVETGSSMPDTESLNSRMPLPSERPISGSRFAPKTSRRTISRMMSSR